MMRPAMQVPISHRFPQLRGHTTINGPPFIPAPRCQTVSNRRLIPLKAGGKLVERIAAAIEIDDSVSRFETVAGRSAMMGFVSAAVAEFVLPAGSLFGGLSGEQLSAFSSLALFAVTCSALLAVASKRRSGTRLTEAVFASLTALSRSAGSLSLTSVDEAVDSVFSAVFTDDLIRDYIEDEFI